MELREDVGGEQHEEGKKQEIIRGIWKSEGEIISLKGIAPIFASGKA